MPTKYIFCLILYVILSGEKRLRFAESKFHRAKSEVKSRRQSAAGIWLKISVAYQRNVTSIQKATQTPSHIPSSHSLLGFVSDRRRERLTPSTKLRLRALRSAQNDRLIVRFIKCFVCEFVLFFLFLGGRRVNRLFLCTIIVRFREAKRLPYKGVEKVS